MVGFSIFSFFAFSFRKIYTTCWPTLNSSNSPSSLLTLCKSESTGLLISSTLGIKILRFCSFVFDFTFLSFSLNISVTCAWCVLQLYVRVCIVVWLCTHTNTYIHTLSIDCQYWLYWKLVRIPPQKGSENVIYLYMVINLTRTTNSLLLYRKLQYIQYTRIYIHLYI